MNKSELISYISEKHDCTKVKAEKIIDVFTSSITSTLSVIVKVKGTSKLHEKGTREFGVT